MLNHLERVGWAVFVSVFPPAQEELFPFSLHPLEERTEQPLSWGVSQSLC